MHCIYYLVLILDERPQFALAFASGFFFDLFRVGQAVFRHRPLHGLPIVLELHISWGLKAGLVGVHHLL